MGLTTSEVESLRLHLGYGNIGPYGAPYTPDTFLELFEGVVAPNLSTGAETTATGTISAGASATVTPGSMTDIAPYTTLVVDTGDEAEAVVVRSVTLTTFNATFLKAHAGTYPIAVMCGVARLRLLLWDADAAWRGLTSLSLSSQAGIKKVDEVEFFEGFGGLSGRRAHYLNIVGAIAALVQVPPKNACGNTGRLEAY
ncbi:MAG TPA: hypothetical protein VGK73_08635 [Polyangiaceae bacterium]